MNDFLDELSIIEAEVQNTVLAEAFDEAFFAIVRKQILDIHEQGANRLSSIYAVIQESENRDRLKAFLTLVKSKLSSKPTEWRHLCKRLSSLDGTTDLEALFEVVIIGNILSQLPNENVDLNVKTNGSKDVDAVVKLVNRKISIEITMLGASVETQKRREIREKHNIKYQVWSGIGEGDGGRVKDKITEKTLKFKENMPNVLIIEIFEVWDRMLPMWEDNVEQLEKDNISLLLTFHRVQLTKKFIGDSSCQLTKEEERKLIELFHKENFRGISYL